MHQRVYVQYLPCVSNAISESIKHFFSWVLHSQAPACSTVRRHWPGESLTAHLTAQVRAELYQQLLRQLAQLRSGRTDHNGELRCKGWSMCYTRYLLLILTWGVDISATLIRFRFSYVQTIASRCFVFSRLVVQAAFACPSLAFQRSSQSERIYTFPRY